MAVKTIVDEVQITDKHREAAIERADVSHCDSDMGRGEEQHKIDSRVGMLGEVVFEDIIGQTKGIEFTDPEDTQHDCFLNGHRTELKTRKTWNYQNPDLLVRTKFDLAAKYYVQLDLYTENDDAPDLELSNIIRGEIVGVVTKAEVKRYGEDFRPAGKRNDTLLVERKHLHPFHNFTDAIR